MLQPEKSAIIILTTPLPDDDDKKKKKKKKVKPRILRANVLAQLVELLFPIPEVSGLNPVICNLYSTHNRIEKTIIKRKRPGMDKKEF